MYRPTNDTNEACKAVRARAKLRNVVAVVKILQWTEKETIGGAMSCVPSPLVRQVMSSKRHALNTVI